jgi:hypothetical protein
MLINCRGAGFDVMFTSNKENVAFEEFSVELLRPCCLPCILQCRAFHSAVQSSEMQSSEMLGANIKK